MHRTKYFIPALVAVAIGLISLPAGPANAAPDYDAEGWSAKMRPDASGNGVQVDLEVAEGHYVYLWMMREGKKSMRITLDFQSSAGGKVTGAIAWPKAKEKHDEVLDQDVAIYETGKVTIPVALKFDKPGSYKTTIETNMRAQACTVGRPGGNFCKIPRTITISTALKLTSAVVPTPRATPIVTPNASPTPKATPTVVVEASPPSPSPSPSPTPLAVTPVEDLPKEASFFSLLSAEGGFEAMMGRGLIWLLLFIFIGGLAVNLTPCVYPLIPITVSVVGARAASSRGRALVLSLAYVGGMTIVNAALGVIAGATGQRIGFIFTYPPVVFGVAALLFVLALGMFGVINLQLPSSVQTKLNTFGGGGVGGVFVIGLVAGVIASPCSTPVLGGIATVIVVGKVGIPTAVLFMLVFSAGMGLPFVVLGTFSGMLASLPKSGVWMNVVKDVFGVGIAAGGYYFLSLALPEWAFYLSLGAGLLIGAAVLATGYLFPESSRTPQAALGALIGALGLYFFLGGMGGSGLGPNLNIGPGTGTKSGSGEITEKIDWRRTEAAALSQAAAEGKPIFVDFWTDECKPCKQLDRKTFQNPGVIAMLEKDFIPTKLDLTERAWTTNEQKTEIKRLVGKYPSTLGGVPRLLFIAPDGTVMKGLGHTGFENAEKFTKRLEKAIACADQPTNTLVCKI